MRTLIMRILDVTAVSLLVIGGLCWGFYGLFGFNFLEALFCNALLWWGECTGDFSLDRLFYVIFGLSALYVFFRFFNAKEHWQKGTTKRRATTKRKTTPRKSRVRGHLRKKTKPRAGKSRQSRVRGFLRRKRRV